MLLPLLLNLGMFGEAQPTKGYFRKEKKDTSAEEARLRNERLRLAVERSFNNEFGLPDEDDPVIAAVQPHVRQKKGRVEIDWDEVYARVEPRAIEAFIERQRQLDLERDENEVEELLLLGGH